MLTLVTNGLNDGQLVKLVRELAEDDLTDGACISEHPCTLAADRIDEQNKVIEKAKEFLEHLVQFNCYGAEGAIEILKDINTQ